MNLQEFLDKLPNTNKKVVSIFSGGLDSTVLTYALVKKYGKENVIALSYQYRQKHQIELECSKYTANKLGIKQKFIDISFLGEINKDFSSLANDSSIETPDGKEVIEEKQSSNYIANRNSILINIAVSFAETVDAEYVFYGAQSNDYAGFWDCTTDFVNSLNNTFKLNREHTIQVVAPFMGLWKEDEIKLGVDLDVDFTTAWTCYNPQREEVMVDGKKGHYLKPCKKCLSCVERMEAFNKAGVEDKQYV